VLGTDGFGRSDTRANLRRFFEVDRYYIAHAAIAALAKEGKMTARTWPGRSSSTRSIRRRRTRWGFDI
jgi:pyruvate dehydrogenase complex dehydrogenase (E1) component